MRTDKELLKELEGDPEPLATITDPALIEAYKALAFDQAAEWFENEAEPQHLTRHDEDKAVTALAAAHLAKIEAEQRINEAV